MLGHSMKAGLFAIALAACSSPEKHVDAPSSAWSQGPDLADGVPRLEPGVTALGQRLVIVGGFDSDLQAGLDITTRVDMFDPLANAWTRLPDGPVAWTHIQLAGVGTKLYLLGGLAGQTYTAEPDCYVLDTLDATPTWTPLAPIPTGFERGSAAVVVAMPRIYLLGGAGTNGALATDLYYDGEAGEARRLCVWRGAGPARVRGRRGGAGRAAERRELRPDRRHVDDERGHAGLARGHARRRARRSAVRARRRTRAEVRADHAALHLRAARHRRSIDPWARACGDSAHVAPHPRVLRVLRRRRRPEEVQHRARGRADATRHDDRAVDGEQLSG